MFYNADDPVKAQYVRDTIKSQVQDANTALTKRLSEVALEFLDLIGTGGQYNFLGRDFDVLGLERSEQILREARADLPRGSPARRQIDQVIALRASSRARTSTSPTTCWPRSARRCGSSRPSSTAAPRRSARSPWRSRWRCRSCSSRCCWPPARWRWSARRTPSCGWCAGWSRAPALLLEKAGLAAVCSLVVCLLMLAGLGLFVDLAGTASRCGWRPWPPGRWRSRRMGLAVGALTREVRAASLLCVMLSLPLTFLALVPSGSVSPALFDVVRVVSALFPFKPTLDALDAALNDSGDDRRARCCTCGALFLAFGAASRLALRRFASVALRRRLEGRWPFPPPACGACAGRGCCAAWCARPS